MSGPVGGPGPVGDSPEELLALARSCAVTAGDLVRDERPSDLGVAATKSSSTDVVTAMDLAAEALVRRALALARPHDGVLGEEDGFVAGTSGLTWVVDPIDGTVNYLYGLPAYAVSVAVVRAGGEDPLACPDPSTWTAVAGCVHAPETGETWTASAGGGAHHSRRGAPERRLTAAQEPPLLAGALVGTGFGYRSSVRAAQSRVLTGVLPRVRDVRRIGSAVLDLCAVADGRLDAYYEQGLQAWDLAAGALVVAEAGGVVLSLPPGPQDGSGPAGSAAGAAPDNGPTLVAGPPRLAGELADALGAPHRSE